MANYAEPWEAAKRGRLAKEYEDEVGGRMIKGAYIL